MPARGLAVEETGRLALVVEDERLMRMIIVDALAQCGYQVLEAEDGPSGLRVMQVDRSIELLISDHRLPGSITGRDLAQTAVRMHPTLCALLISGLPGSVVIGDAPLPERVGWLQKPFSMVRLVQTVLEIAKRGREPPLAR